MQSTRERILLVEDDPDIRDLIGRQTLQALGYEVDTAQTAAQALQSSAHHHPDLVIANFNLPDLSGKDLLVAFTAQRLEAPVIMLARKGMEGDMIQAFRLGASDYLLLPPREAEVVTAVERALKQVRARQEKDLLVQRLQHSNEDLQHKVRDLTTLMVMSKTLLAIPDPLELSEKIVEGAIFLAEADLGWLLIRTGHSKAYILKAQRNLPKPLSDGVGHPWDDGISSLVGLSGEGLNIHGKPLKRFQVSQLGQSALVVPLRHKKEVLGILVVMRKADLPFNAGNKALLEAVADYASIAWLNTSRDQLSAANRDEAVRALRLDLGQPLLEAKVHLQTLLADEDLRLKPEQKGVLRAALEKLAKTAGLLDAVSDPRQKIR